MKKLLLFLSVVLVFGNAFSQKMDSRITITDTTARHQLYVCFEAGVSRIAIDEVATKYNITFKKGYSLSDEKLRQLENAAIANKNDVSAVNRLRNTFIATIDDASNKALLALATALDKLEIVESCSLMSMKPIAPPTDITPSTFNYEPAQTYIGANPGVNMTFAWNAGLSGSGIRIRDVEYGLNKNHEEFNSVAGAFVQSGMTISSDATVDYTEHGTAVFGIVYADKGTYGISGMAYGAQEMVLFPEWQQSGYDRAFAVAEAIENSVQGDVIIYEMQAYGVNDNYVPAEYELPIYNLTQAASNAGIIIVAAAGNGNQNLDSAAYSNYMLRGDSGAIIVGAGTPSTAHNRLSYSTYGDRVNVQAWGSNVRSSGYGDFLMVGGDFNQSYTNFSGTSSATPIVASCVAVLQSYYHAQTGGYLSPAEMRNILVSTGIPQGTGGHIGPIPNMQSAPAAIDQLATKKFDSLTFALFPNPASDIVTIGGNIASDASVVIVDGVGKTVYSGRVGDKSIDVSSLTSGVYFVKIDDGASKAVKKIVKR